MLLQIKRLSTGAKIAVGATPAPKPSSRRESSIFGTPSVARPPSALSDVSSTTKERKPGDSLSTAPRLSLARSVRPNGSAVNSSRRSDASMGPPSAVKIRTSPTSIKSATPSRVASNLARSSSLTPIVKTHRRPSSSLESLRNKTLVSQREAASSASNTSEQEKENVDSTPVANPKSARQIKVLVPA